MKKILAITILAAVTTLTHAQGYFEYYGLAANIQTNTALGTFFGGTGTGGSVGKTGNAASGQLYYFELLYATTTVSGDSSPTNAAWSPVLAYGGGALALGTNGSSAGSLFGPGNAGGIASALTAGSASSIELVGWSASLGSSLSSVLSIITSGTSAQAGFLGWTPVESLTPTPSTTGQPILYSSGVIPNGTLVLFAAPVSVPEPATLALAALGGASLLLFRRRKV